MSQSIGLLTLVVDDYDRAIAWYRDVLGFQLLEDVAVDGKRWVRVAPPGSTGTALLLARANDATQAAAIGNQAGGRVFLFLQTDDFWRDHAAFLDRGVTFLETPREEDYGTVAVFVDLFGNKWDLLQLGCPRRLH